MDKQCNIDMPHLADNYKKKRTKGFSKTVCLICPSHGFIRGDHCPHCVPSNKSSFNINDESWVSGYYEHIDTHPIYIRDRKHLINECAKRNSVPRAFMKRNSQGKGITITKY